MEKKTKQEITIAYGKETQLTTIGEKQKQVFLKFSPAFRYRQLKLLKGSALSVFICYALHTDENAYCFPDTKTIIRETGFSKDAISEARKLLVKNNFLYSAKLVDKKNRLRDWIYRIFQPIELNRTFFVRNKFLYPQGKKTDVGKSPMSGNLPPIIEEELKDNNSKEELLRIKEQIKNLKKRLTNRNF